MCSYTGSNYSKEYRVIKSLSTVVENRAYCYRILKSQFINLQGNIVQAYGIEIEKIEMINNEVISIERDMVEYISPILHKVSNLLSKLHSNNVSPIHLTDVIGEYVDDYVSDFDGFSINKASNYN